MRRCLAIHSDAMRTWMRWQLNTPQRNFCRFRLFFRLESFILYIFSSQRKRANDSLSFICLISLWDFPWFPLISFFLSLVFFVRCFVVRIIYLYEESFRWLLSNDLIHPLNEANNGTVNSWSKVYADEIERHLILHFAHRFSYTHCMHFEMEWNALSFAQVFSINTKQQFDVCAIVSLCLDMLIMHIACVCVCVHNVYAFEIILLRAICEFFHNCIIIKYLCFVWNFYFCWFGFVFCTGKSTGKQWQVFAYLCLLLSFLFDCLSWIRI